MRSSLAASGGVRQQNATLRLHLDRGLRDDDEVWIGFQTLEEVLGQLSNCR